MSVVASSRCETYVLYVLVLCSLAALGEFILANERW